MMATNKKDNLSLHLDLPFQDILTIFQIGNPNAYYVSGIDQSDNMIADTRELLRLLGADSYQHFRQPHRLHNITNFFQMQAQGSFISAMTYTFQRHNEARHTEHFNLMIGKMEISEEDPTVYSSITVHYNLNGDIEKGTFIPHDSMCLVRQSNPPREVMLRAHNEDFFYGTICYADAALKTIFAGSTLSIEQNQSWLTEDVEFETEDKFKSLCKRTAKDISLEIKDLPYKSSNINIMPTTSYEYQ